jgi:Fe-S oxidoreductase
MWMEEHEGERINNMRTDQAIATQAGNIAVACPFCLTMMTDGLKARGMEEKITSLDIAEITWKAMGLEEEKLPADVCAVTG